MKSRIMGTEFRITQNITLIRGKEYPKAKIHTAITQMQVEFAQLTEKFLIYGYYLLSFLIIDKLHFCFYLKLYSLKSLILVKLFLIWVVPQIV